MKPLLVESMIRELDEITLRLRQAEEQYVEAVNRLNGIILQLFEKECTVIQEGKVKGADKKTRRAELWRYTRELHGEKRKAEEEVHRTRTVYHHFKREFENAQLASRLLVQVNEPQPTGVGKPLTFER